VTGDATGIMHQSKCFREFYHSRFEQIPAGLTERNSSTETPNYRPKRPRSFDCMTIVFLCFLAMAYPLQIDADSITESPIQFFERFVGLQLLYVSGLPYGPGEDQPLVMFEIDGTMPSLREMFLSTPFCCTETQQQVNLSLCLPSICQLYVLVLGNPHGARLAQGVFDLSQLTYLGLCILDGTLPWIVLVVPRASSVSTLRLVGYTKPEVSLEIEKERDFAFECRGVPNVSMPRPHRQMSRLKLI